MITIKVLLDRLLYIWAMIPLLTWKRTWNLMKAIALFFLKSGNSTSTPPIWILSVTSDCNYNCIMCFKTSSQQSKLIDYSKAEEMDFDLLQALLYEHYQKLFFVRIHGGEPLVYSHFLDLVKLLNELNIPYDFVTNGSKLDSELLEEIVGKYCVNVSISLDAVSEETYSNIRVGGSINKISKSLLDIQRLKEKKRTIRPVMNASMCTFRFNLSQMSKLVKYCADYGISSLSISEGVNYGTPKIKESDLVKNNKEATHLEIKNSVSIAKKLGIVVRLKFASLSNNLYKDIPYHKAKITPKNCLNLYGSIWLTPSFEMISCSSSSHSFGNIVIDNMQQIWNGKQDGYQNARKSFANSQVPESCKSCIYSGGFFS